MARSANNRESPPPRRSRTILRRIVPSECLVPGRSVGDNSALHLARHNLRRRQKGSLSPRASGASPAAVAVCSGGPPTGCVFYGPTSRGATVSPVRPRGRSNERKATRTPSATRGGPFSVSTLAGRQASERCLWPCTTDTAEPARG